MKPKHSSTGSVALEVEWKKAAIDDLIDMVDYISDENPEAAQRLLDDIAIKAANLPLHPKIYRQGRVAGTREMVVHENYVVVYTESAKAISILRVLHAAQSWPPG